MRAILIIVSLALGVASASAQDCRSIQDPAARLQCFDAQTPRPSEDAYVAATRRLVGATVSPDIIPADFDPTPLARCLRSARITMKEMEAMTRKEQPARKARACYDRHIGL